MSSAIAVQTRSERSFPRGWVPFVLGVFAIWAALSFSSHTIQIAPHPTHGSGLLVASVGLTLLGSLLGFTAARADAADRIKSILAFGGAAAIGSFMLYAPASDALREWRDFPRSSTREYRTLIPILSAENHQGARASSTWVRISRYNVSVRITLNDYQFMQRMLATSSNEINRRGYFCADVVIQQSGDAVRIMHTTTEHLAPGSIVLCSGLSDSR